MAQRHPLTEESAKHYHRFDRESVSFLRSRYNRITRWVIADIVRRSAYRYPEKPALIFGDQVLTYAELDEATNRVAQGLLALGLKRFDRVAILAHNTIHHVLTWLGTAKAGGITWPSTICFEEKTSPTASTIRRHGFSSWKTPWRTWWRASWRTCPP